ncbi:MAG TPA: HAMP domain-containing sensor histidine kinase [Armatimonadota bacterium]
MIPLLNGLGRRSWTSVLGIGLLLVVLVGLLDYWTGPELAFTIFYLFPVALVAWFKGIKAGFIVSVASALSWFIADMYANANYSAPFIPYWNALVGLSFFLIVTYTLVALRRMQDRQEQMTRFIVHDLRSPMTNVITGMQTLKSIAGDQLDDTGRELVDMAVTSGGRVLTMINSLLDVARLSSGRIPLHRQEVAPSALAEGAVAQLALLAQQNAVALQVEIGQGIPPVLVVDKELTTRILVNLLGNAIKFSPTNSIVTVRVAPSPAREVVFTVTDQGPGIPKAWAHKVFEPFSQIEARQAGVAIGTGLGLTFCRLAVEAQGGHIWVESVEGQGTTMLFTVPITPAK